MLFRPEWSDGLGPWRPGKGERPDAWQSDVGGWEPPREPLRPSPPIAHEERMSMWRRAFDEASLLAVSVVCSEMESECFTESDAGAEATRGWIRSISEAQREGLFDEQAARSFIAEAVGSRLEVPDLEYDMLWERWHDLRVAHGFPLGQAFHESPDYPASAQEVDDAIDARYAERVVEILEDAGEWVLAEEIGENFALFETMTQWDPPAELEAKSGRWATHRDDGWRPTNVPWPRAKHAVLDGAIAEGGDPADLRVIAAAHAAILLFDRYADWRTDKDGIRSLVLALGDSESVRGPLLQFLDGLAQHDDWDESEGWDERSAALVVPLFDIAQAFEDRGRPLLAADLYWMIESHGSSWTNADRALAKRKRIEAGLRSTAAAGRE